MVDNIYSMKVAGATIRNLKQAWSVPLASAAYNWLGLSFMKGVNRMNKESKEILYFYCQDILQFNKDIATIQHRRDKLIEKTKKEFGLTEKQFEMQYNNLV